MIRLLAFVIALLPLAAHAACTGKNLIDALPAPDRAAIRARVDAVPYPRGNYWRATRDGQTVTLIGTYHLDDPRFEAVIPALEATLEGATALLVEAGPKEEAALQQSIARNPAAFLAPEGASLMDTLPPDEWEALAAELRSRGIPAFFGARFRASYVAMLLSMPPCAIESATAKNGLDKRLLAHADRENIPVQALEPFDTALGIFDALDMESQSDQIRSAILLAATGADQMVTLADAYFAGDSRLIWEFTRHITLGLPGMTPEKVDADFAQTEDILVSRRNRAWIPVIEAAGSKGPIVAAFGALHLSGETGVLNLLAKDGWTITPLPLP